MLHRLKGSGEHSEGEVLVMNAMLHDEFGLIYQGSFEDIIHDIWKQTTITNVEVLEFHKDCFQFCHIPSCAIQGSGGQISHS